MTLDELPTPCLILDRTRLEENARRMAGRMSDLGVNLRPHMKTAKSADVAQLATAGHTGGITVSTVAEARYFAGNGFSDILYAVGLTPDKIEALAAIQAQTGARLITITDDPDAAGAIAERAASLKIVLPVRIEADCGGGRAGIWPDDPRLVETAGILDAASHTALDGIMTHAGQSYGCRTVEEIRTVAETERAMAVQAAEALKQAGLPCPEISVGSTPTAAHAAHLDGVTEARPGVYMFSDLTQTELFWGGHENIAVSVLATVIGQRRDIGQILIDAGGLALSKDRSMDAFDSEIGYGLVCDSTGTKLFDGVSIPDAHQEHGILRARTGGTLPFDDMPIGSRVRVLPVHACMTAAMYAGYHVVEDGGEEVVAEWPRASGW